MISHERTVIFKKNIDEVFSYLSKFDNQNNSRISNKYLDLIINEKDNLDIRKIWKKAQSIKGLRDPKDYMQQHFRIYNQHFLEKILQDVEAASNYVINLLKGGDFIGQMNSLLVDRRKDVKLFYKLTGKMLSRKIDGIENFIETRKKLIAISNSSYSSLVKRILRDFVMQIAQITEKKLDDGKFVTNQLERENIELKEKIQSRSEIIEYEVLNNLFEKLNNQDTDYILDKLVNYVNNDKPIEFDFIALKAIFKNILRALSNTGIESFGKEGEIINYKEKYTEDYAVKGLLDHGENAVVTKPGWKVKGKIIRQAFIEKKGEDK